MPKVTEQRCWAALRDGVHGELADLVTGEPVPTRRRLHRLLDEVEPEAPHGLDAARALAERTAADALRDAGIRRVIPWMTEVFVA